MFPATETNDIDIYSIDFDWIKNTKNLRLLRKAKKILDDDGPSHYPDLYKALIDKLCEIDPKQRLLLEKNQPIDYQTQLDAEQELADWEANMQKQEKDVERSKNKNKQKEIFEGEEDKEIEPEVEEIPEAQKRIIAENEKNKGNEALRSKDYDEAIQYYNKSLNYDPTFAISYCNRALAYLKLKKNYEQAISDCNNALKYDPSYLKAYYRRGEAYLAQKLFIKAVEDFSYIMEKEPSNQEVNAKLKDAREQLKKQTDKENKNKNNFTRVQIVEEEEDSDEEEGQQQLEKEKNEETKVEKLEEQVDQNLSEKIQENQEVIPESKKTEEKPIEQQKQNFIEEIKQYDESQSKNENEKNVLLVNSQQSEEKTTISAKFISEVQKNVIEELLITEELPSTATTFEKNIAAFKNNIELLFQYLIKIEPKLSVYYTKKGISYEVFNKIIQSLNLNGIRFKNLIILQLKSTNPIKATQILIHLANTFQFDLLLMMTSQSDKKGSIINIFNIYLKQEITELFEKLQQANENKEQIIQLKSKFIKK